MYHESLQTNIWIWDRVGIECLVMGTGYKPCWILTLLGKHGECLSPYMIAAKCWSQSHPPPNFNFTKKAILHFCCGSSLVASFTDKDLSSEFSVLISRVLVVA